MTDPDFFPAPLSKVSLKKYVPTPYPLDGEGWTVIGRFWDGQLRKVTVARDGRRLDVAVMHLEAS